MSYVLIIHEVADYIVWKRVFDEAAGARSAAGEISYQLLRYASDENHVAHFSEWISADAARAFFESAELVSLRQRAGVIAPEFLYLEQLEAGVF